jgi:hypothetical protein
LHTFLRSPRNESFGLRQLLVAIGHEGEKFSMRAEESTVEDKKWGDR